MASVLHGIGPSVAFTVVGVLLLLTGFVLIDWLTPGDLRRHIWVERNRNAAVYLSSAMVGLGAIIFTAIITSDADFTVGLASTLVYGLLGQLLMAGAFWVVDVLTPGRLGEILVDAQPHGAVWVSASVNLAVAAIVSASIS
jgi:uncharacterized membrane protein YjfL (UPF0719 family)